MKEANQGMSRFGVIMIAVMAALTLFAPSVAVPVTTVNAAEVAAESAAEGAQDGNTNRRLTRLEATVAAQSTDIALLKAAVFGAATATPGVTPTATATATAQPTPTVTTAPTSAPTSAPSATPGHIDMALGKCGEPMDRWHAAVIGTCETGHEHGDAPPDWVLNSGYLPLFMHAMGTGPAENSLKHACMKGYSESGPGGTQWYLIHHGCSMPFDRLSRFHSWQLWIREANTNISYLSGWVDYGDPKHIDDGGNRAPSSQFDEFHNNQLLFKGIMRIDTRPQPVCEQWYSSVGGPNPNTSYWYPDFAWLACGSVTAYTDNERRYARGERPAGYDPYNPSSWVLTGALGFDRQVDISIYADRISDKRGRTFVHDQFGEEMASLSDPRCGQMVTGPDGVSYARQCVENKVSATLGTLKDIVRRDYFAPGVQAPN